MKNNPKAIHSMIHKVTAPGISLIATNHTNKMTQTMNKMNDKQLEQFKLNYAELIVEGMDMDSLITFAVESIEQNIKDWDENDVKSEILDCYGEETLMDLMPEQSQTK